MNDKTIILPSARAIRHELLEIKNPTLFLPNYITMSEFIDKLTIVKDYKTIDSDARVLLLMQAADFKEFANLQIERNFFTFTKNSSYIFKFFEELSAERYDIDNLSNADIYAEYEEHIEILKELYKRYERLCDEHNILDQIFLPKLYRFNSSYAASHKEIELVLSGYLTNFELELLEKSTNYTNIKIRFSASGFNKKMQSRFAEFGIECEENYSYLIDFNNKIILEKEKIELNKNISCESFSESLLQISFIKKKVYEFVKKGYKPQNIAVVLPDEKIASMLKLFDSKSNFNFAMGESFANTEVYKKIDATLQEIDQESQENIARLNRVDNHFYKDFLDICFKKTDEIDFIELISKYKEFITKKVELKIFDEEIYRFGHILEHLKEMSVKSSLNLFLQRLSQRTLDDVRGGQITVMGVLETRSVSFDAIVIVDFNDSKVPKKSDKDMFLNSSIREHSKLPTTNDRENLQKHYYYQLINSSKEVAISFVKSSDAQGSKFLKQLGIKEKSSYDESLYASLLFASHKDKLYKYEKEIVLEYSFKDKMLSATKLKTFLTCKRKFFYKHIDRLESHEVPKDIPKEYEIGTAVHNALKNLYSTKNRYTDATALKKDLYKELDKQTTQNELYKYLMAIQKKGMDRFVDYEIKRFIEGWEVLGCRLDYKCSYGGITLHGRVDRVDKKECEIYVLDYKTGNYPLYNKNNFTDATDFQLEFYYLLTKHLGEISRVGYYDLKEYKIVDEPFLNEKLEVLKSKIADLLNYEEIEFSKCEDSKNCIYCDYKVICGRD